MQAVYLARRTIRMASKRAMMASLVDSLRLETWAIRGEEWLLYCLVNHIIEQDSTLV
jgi:hypothetical protein